MLFNVEVDLVNDISFIVICKGFLANDEVLFRQDALREAKIKPLTTVEEDVGFEDGVLAHGDVGGVDASSDSDIFLDGGFKVLQGGFFGELDILQ